MNNATGAGLKKEKEKKKKKKRKKKVKNADLENADVKSKQTLNRFHFLFPCPHFLQERLLTK